MIYRIETYIKPEYLDVHGQEILSDIRQLGIRMVEALQ